MSVGKEGDFSIFKIINESFLIVKGVKKVDKSIYHLSIEEGI
jgi:hypothetical protein